MSSNKMEIILKSMLKDVKEHQRPKNTLLEFYVTTRLDKALNTYYAQLLENYSILSGVNEVKVLKNLVKD